MNIVNLYEGSNKVQRQFCREKLKICKNKFNFASSEKSSALYLGCGIGSAMMTEFVPEMPENITRIVGTDTRAENIQNICDLFPPRPRIQYQKLDLQDADTLPNEKFDNVASFWCLRWVHNPEIALRNLYNMLNEKASGLLIFEYLNFYFQIVRCMARTVMWRRYLHGMLIGMTPYEYGFNPRNFVGKELHKLNLTKLEISADENRVYRYSTIEDMQDCLSENYSIDEMIPPDRLDFFYEDIYNYLYVNNRVIKINEDVEIINIPVKMFTAMFIK